MVGGQRNTLIMHQTARLMKYKRQNAPFVDCITQHRICIVSSIINTARTVARRWTVVKMLDTLIRALPCVLAGLAVYIAISVWTTRKAPWWAVALYWTGVAIRLILEVVA